jgi:hypothetical protein
MDRLELLKQFYPDGDISKRCTQDTSKYTTFEMELKNLTPFLPNNTPSRTRLFYIKLDLHEPQFCNNPSCNNLVSPDRNNKFKTYCSNECQRTCTNNLLKSNSKKHEESILRKESNVCRYCGKQLVYVRKENKHRCTNFLCKVIEKYSLDRSFLEIDKVSSKYLHNLLDLLNIPYNKSLNISELKYCLKNNLTTPPEGFTTEHLYIKQQAFIDRQKNKLLDHNILLSNNFFPYELHCQTCKNVFTHSLKNVTYNPCKMCNPKPYGTSYAELEVKEFIESLGFRTEAKRLPGVNEIDIFIPELNIGFEYNGLYWHSESMGKDKNYHLNKQKISEELGITLFHIFEHHWLNKQEIVKYN